MKKTILFALCLIALSPLRAQQQLSPTEQAIMQPIFDLFDAYRAGDSTAMRATFTADAVLQRAGEKEGKPFLAPASSIDGFLQYVGSGLEKKHDEAIWNFNIHHDGRLASVWMDYAFYLGGEFHHCGRENFLLFQGTDGWKIFHIVDTSRTEGCEVPQEVRVKHEG